MLQICFVVRRHFDIKVVCSRSYWWFIRNICLIWHQNLLLNLQKFEKFKKGYCPKIMLFCFSFTCLSAVSKVYCDKIKSEILAQVNRNLRKKELHLLLYYTNMTVQDAWLFMQIRKLREEETWCIPLALSSSSFLVNRKGAQNALEEKHKLKSINLYDDDNTDTNKRKKIFINQTYCTYYRRLYGFVKDLNNEGLTYLFWIVNGTRKIRKSSQTKPISVTHEFDLQFWGIKSLDIDMINTDFAFSAMKLMRFLYWHFLIFICSRLICPVFVLVLPINRFDCHFCHLKIGWISESFPSYTYCSLSKSGD